MKFTHLATVLVQTDPVKQKNGLLDNGHTTFKSFLGSYVGGAGTYKFKNSNQTQYSGIFYAEKKIAGLGIGQQIRVYDDTGTNLLKSATIKALEETELNGIIWL